MFWVLWTLEVGIRLINLSPLPCMARKKIQGHFHSPAKHSYNHAALWFMLLLKAYWRVTIARPSPFPGPVLWTLRGEEGVPRMFRLFAPGYRLSHCSIFRGSILRREHSGPVEEIGVRFLEKYVARSNAHMEDRFHNIVNSCAIVGPGFNHRSPLSTH